MGMGPSLPGGPNGQFQIGYAPLLKGLEQAGTAKGSLAFTAITVDTDVAITFEVTDGKGTGTLLNFKPLAIRLRLWDGATQVAGAWNSSIQGDANATTVHAKIDATGWTQIECAGLFDANGTLYVRFAAAPSAGQIEYILIAARDVDRA